MKLYDKHFYFMGVNPGIQSRIMISAVCNFQANITRPNCAVDRSTILGLYVPGFQRQVFKHVKILLERSKRRKEQKKNKGSVLVAESA